MKGSRRILQQAVMAGTAAWMMLFGSSCATLRALLAQAVSSVKLPTVKVTSVVPELQALDRAVLHFSLRIDNPNPISLQLASLGYDLDVEGKGVATGKTKKGLTIKASGSSPTAVDVTVNLIAVAASLADLLAKGQANYTGTFLLGFTTQAGNLEVPVSHKGNFPLPKQPPIALENVSLLSIDLSKAVIGVAVRVDNPNPFPLRVDTLRCGLKVNNRNVGEASAPSALEVPVGTPLLTTLKIAVPIANLGLTALDLTRTPRLDYKASLNFEMGALKLPLEQAGRVKW